MRKKSAIKAPGTFHHHVEVRVTVLLFSPYVFSSTFRARSVGFTILGVISCVYDCLLPSHGGGHIPSVWMLHAGCFLLLAFTHLRHEFS